MRRRPQHTRSVVHITVCLDIDREPPILFVCKRGPHSSRRIVADAATALAADVVIVLIHVPKPSRPSADESLPSDQRPIFIPDERPQLGRKPGKTDRTFIPAPAR